MRRAAFFTLTVLALVLIDQGTKQLALSQVSPDGPTIISPAFAQFRLSENQAAAFGLFNAVRPEWRTPLFHLVSLGTVLLGAFYLSRLRGAPGERWAQRGLLLLLGGALGNEADRLLRGAVVDFIELHWFERAWWPAFNLADAAIVTGAACLLIDALLRPGRTAMEAR